MKGGVGKCGGLMDDTTFLDCRGEMWSEDCVWGSTFSMLSSDTASSGVCVECSGYISRLFPLISEVLRANDGS